MTAAPMPIKRRFRTLTGRTGGSQGEETPLFGELAAGAYLRRFVNTTPLSVSHGISPVSVESARRCRATRGRDPWWVRPAPAAWLPSENKQQRGLDLLPESPYFLLRPQTEMLEQKLHVGGIPNSIARSSCAQGQRLVEHVLRSHFAAICSAGMRWPSTRKSPES